MTIPITVECDPKNAVKAVQREDVIIIIDVLRCTSSIITMLANDAKSVITTSSVNMARRIHTEHPEFILAGERRGTKPKGFDLGNSPLAFSPEAVREKHVILTTTNGTKAISNAKGSKWVLIGALLNAKSGIKTAFSIAEREETGISLVLSGKKGSFSFEDFLCAGAMSEKLPPESVEYSDAALAAVLSFQQARDSLETIVQQGTHAKYLISLGKPFVEDIQHCCQLDKYEVVPYLKGGYILPLIM
jgi:2-phosphosulfolactate phosphatase